MARRRQANTAKEVRRSVKRFTTVQQDYMSTQLTNLRIVRDHIERMRWPWVSRSKLLRTLDAILTPDPSEASPKVARVTGRPRPAPAEQPTQEAEGEAGQAE